MWRSERSDKRSLQPRLEWKGRVSHLHSASLPPQQNRERLERLALAIVGGLAPEGHGLAEYDRFLRMRRAVISGGSVHDLTDDARREAGFAQPRTFKLIQAGLSIVPAALVIKVLDVLTTPGAIDPDDASQLVLTPATQPTSDRRPLLRDLAKE